MKKEETKIIQLKKEKFSFGLTTILIGIALLIIAIAFLYLLSVKVPEHTFGIEDFIFALVFAVITTLALHWLKFFMQNRPYFGLIMGLFALLIFEYALFQQYKGPYTTVFAVITGLIVIVYLGFHFFKSRGKSKYLEGKEVSEEN